MRHVLFRVALPRLARAAPTANDRIPMRLAQIATLRGTVVPTGCASIMNDTRQPMRIETKTASGASGQHPLRRRDRRADRSLQVHRVLVPDVGPLVFGVVALLALQAASGAAIAQGWYAAQPVQAFRVFTNEAMLQVGGTPPGTCANWGTQFRIDNTTAYGRQFVAVLLAAQASSRRVEVWYTLSTAVGTTHVNGCNSATMAQLMGVAMQD